MRLRTLTLRNVKLLADQTFSFVRADETTRTWTALLGDNGVCKTTILQAIAIASSGDRLSRVLARDAADYIDASEQDRAAEIEATFETDVGERTVTMSVNPGDYVFKGDESAQFFNEVRDKRQPGYLVVGYGVGRRLPRRGEVAISSDPVSDRVEGLFDTHHKMLGVDFFEALKDQKEDLGIKYAEALGDVLLAEDEQGNRLLPWLVSFDRRGRGGVNEMRKLLESRRLGVDVGRDEVLKLAPHFLSQGYQSTFAWIADLLGHAFLDAGEAIEPKDLRGIVLLDEIDLHLHPTWQRRMVPLLRQVFPQLQFIVTTHSPLIVTGFEADEVVKLELVEGSVVQRRFDTQPGMQSGTELMSEYFDVHTAARPELVVKQQRLAELLAKDSRTEAETQELGQLESELTPYLTSTDLADLPAPDDINPDDEDDVDPETWRQRLKAFKLSRKRVESE